MKDISNHKQEYYKLRKGIDSFAEKLEKQHKKHLQCRSGCDLCCMDYSIFPIEFYSILDEFKKQKLHSETLDKKQNENDCVFLKDHHCTIYESRPIICRTHGLPLLYTNNEGEWELSACELNFTKFNFENFTIDNTFPQDKFNSKLFQLNKAFISEFTERKYKAFDLIPLKHLIKNIF